MDIRIESARLNGTVQAPASKSVLHRQCIAAAFCSSATVISGVSLCDDTLATIECLQALGARVQIDEDTLTITPIAALQRGVTLNCKESGSTLRFMLPVAAALGADATFIGCGRLPQRPISPLLQALEPGGCTASAPGLPLSLSGQLLGGTFTLPGNVSSQFISGLLLAAPLMRQDCEILLAGKAESLPYIHLTIDVLRQFGVEVEETENRFFVAADARYRSPCQIHCEGDWSNAAFWLAAGALGGNICCKNLQQNSAQGDKAVLDVLRRFGAEVKIQNDTVTVSPAPLMACEIDATHIPDLVPVLSVLAAVAKGTTRITGAARLRIKESDRLTAVAQMLQNLGARVTVLEDCLQIEGQPHLKGSIISSFNDHRIAMSSAVAAVACQNAVTVTEANAVKKSYPTFWNEFARLGATLTYKGDL